MVPSRFKFPREAKVIDPNGILMIEPTGVASVEPLIDSLTRRMAAAYREGSTSEHGYRGVHRCVCGAISDNRDHYVMDKLTNSLCVHYLAFHREEIPRAELSFLIRFLAGWDEVTPTVEELACRN